MAYERSYESVIRKPRRTWFGTLWKPQKSLKGKKSYKGHIGYDDFPVNIRLWGSTHAGCKWAYAYHNRGKNIDDDGVMSHEDCEHIHFVIIQDNAAVGETVINKLGCHLEIPKYGIESCARYLLHLTISSIGKDVVPLEDLYCSGEGEHGKIWFPLISAHEYESFIPNNVLHYVYNDGLTSLLAFMARFGACVTHGAYNSAIRNALEVWKSGVVETKFVRDVFDTMDEDHKRKFVAEVLGRNASQIKSFDFDELFCSIDGKFNYSHQPWAMNFQRLYIWWRCSDDVMNYDLNSMADFYGLISLLQVNEKRVAMEDIIKKNSVFSEELASEIIAKDGSDVE